MKKKILVFTSALLALGLFITLKIMDNPNVDVVKVAAEQEFVGNRNQIQYREIELNNTNCEYVLNEETNTIQIEEYQGNEDCIILPKEIDGYQIENIDVNSFSECYNLETIKIPVEVAEKIDEIPDFEIDNEVQEEGYVVYTTTRQYSEVYEEYLKLSEKERAKTAIIPVKYDVPLEKVYSQEMQELYGIGEIATTANEKYDLRDDIEIEVEHQQSFGNCYAYASLSSVETNLALQKNEIVDLSEIHAAVMTTGYGGNHFFANNDYYANKIGPVYEEYLPMEEIYGNTSNTNYALINSYLSGYTLKDSEIAKIKNFVSQYESVKYVTETVAFSSITQSLKNNSSYKELVQTVRDMVKTHIKTYGSVGAYVAMSGYTEYNGNMVMNNTTSSIYDHGVSIIGWDDNFPKENFPASCRPKSNGAYLVLNSWGEAWGNDGCFWVSYEDKFIEIGLAGVVSVEEPTENINYNSMQIKDIDTNEILERNQIEKEQNVEITVGLSVNSVSSTNKFGVAFRDGKNDFTNSITVKENKIVNNQGNLVIGLDTDKLQGGDYILEITYDDEKINKAIEIIADFHYEINSDNTITITNYIGKTTDATVPTEYDGYKVSAIDNLAFESQNVRNVIISEGISSIGENVFYGCSYLESIELPDSLEEIGLQSFALCTNLQKIELPDKVHTLGKYTFAECSNLKEVKISDGLTTIPEGAFLSCSNLEKIEIGDNVANIEFGAFQKCTALKTIVLPRSVKTIGLALFHSCTNLEKVIIFKETTSIEAGLIYNCPKAAIYCEANSYAQSYARSYGYTYYILTNYTIAYNSNSGSDTVVNMPETQEKVEYDNIVISEKIPTREGYEFLGWSLSQNSNEIAYVPGEKCNENANLTLYAVWEKYEEPAEKLTYDMSGIKFEDAKYVYDRKQKEIVIQGELPEGVTVEYDDNTATDAGEYIATARFIGDTEKYNEIEPMTATLLIEKAVGDIKITNKDSLDKIYDGNGTGISYDVREDGEVLFEYYEATGEILSQPPANVGIYTIKVILKEDKNYTGDTDIATYEIKKATYDMSGIKFEDVVYEYDGEEKSLEITGELPRGVTVKYENNVHTEVGEYVAVAKFTGDTHNYNEIESMTAKLKIISTEKNIKITNKDKLNKIYDGKPVIEPTYEKIGDRTVRIEYYSGTNLLEEAPINAGVYTVRVVLEETTVYPESSDEAVFEIKKAESSIKITNEEELNKIYDNNSIIRPEYEVSRGGMITVEYYIEADGLEQILETSPVNAGKYKVKVILVENENYLEALDEATFEIRKATYDMSNVKFEDAEYEYDGKLHTIEIGGELPKGVSVKYENNIATEVGTYEAIAKFVGDEQNYLPINNMTATMNIVPRKDVDFGKYEIVVENEITYINKIEEQMRVEEFKEKFSEEIIEIYNNGELVENESIIATGMEIRVFNGEETKSYIVVINGDITRDGMINDLDLLMLARYMVGCESEVEYVNEVSLRASDVYEDKETATDKDLLALAKMLLK